MANIGLFIAGIIIIIFSLFNGSLGYVKVIGGKSPKKVLILNIKKLDDIAFLKNLNVIDKLWKFIEPKITNTSKMVQKVIRTLVAMLLCGLLPVIGFIMILVGIGEDKEEE